MIDSSEDPQTLYQVWRGHWPFRQWLYVGITNSPSRRLGEHRRRSEWMLEAGTIRLTRYPDRESVMEAERRMIRAKRPNYNVQHNRHKIEVELSAENLAALGAAICLSILALRWLADVSAEWWVKRQAGRHDAPVELPPRRNPFTEPSVTLTMFETFCTAMVGSSSLTRPPAVPSVGQVPPAPAAPSAAEPEPGQPFGQPAAVTLPFAVLAALVVMFAQHPDTDGEQQGG